MHIWLPDSLKRYVKERVAEEPYRNPSDHIRALIRDDQKRREEQRRFASPWLADVRLWPIQGFEKHLLFYRLIGDTRGIMRVLHGARLAGALWRNPLSGSERYLCIQRAIFRYKRIGCKIAISGDNPRL